MAEANVAWNLQSFLDSLIVELDRAQDSLAVKGVSRPLTYTVKDVSLDLQIFPQYDGKRVRFVTAQPGQDGASGIRFELGSITASHIRETTAKPPDRDEVVLEDVDGLDDDTKDALTRLGVKTDTDVRRLQERNIDLGKVAKSKVPDYADLAKVISRARRIDGPPPAIKKVSVGHSLDGPRMEIAGENLALSSDARFPIAFVDGEEVPVIASGADRVVLAAPGPPRHSDRASALALALDPFTVISLELRS